MKEKEKRIMLRTENNYGMEQEFMENDYLDFEEIDMEFDDDFWDSYDPE